MMSSRGAPEACPSTFYIRQAGQWRAGFSPRGALAPLFGERSSPLEFLHFRMVYLAATWRTL